MVAAGWARRLVISRDQGFNQVLKPRVVLRLSGFRPRQLAA